MTPTADADQSVKTVLILGGGTAGFLSALTLKRRLPQLAIRLIHSPCIPVIGVGESTLVSLPRFLHGVLGIERQRFYEQVRPVWKLGVKLLWGPPEPAHFFYPFGGSYLELHHKSLSRDNAFYCLAGGLAPASLYYALLEQNKSPVLRAGDGRIGFDHQYGYHIENRAFIRFLANLAAERGVEILEGEVTEVGTDALGNIDKLRLADEQVLSADLYVDCSGFASRLLGETLKERYITFGPSLKNDTAVTCAWKRSQPIQSFTTAETMDHGWCWQTEFEQHVNRGYVFSSQFCSTEEAIEELTRKNPSMDEYNVVSFPTGRYDRFWVRNVAAVGNAAGFVEPIQATGIEMIAETAWQLAGALVDADARPTETHRRLANERVAARWEDIRGFLATHFRFNTRLDTPYWRHCREHTELAAAADFVQAYREVGPSRLCEALIPPRSVFGFDGYCNILIGQAVSTAAAPRIEEGEWNIWNSALEQLRDNARHALSIEDALRMVHDPRWKW